MGLNRTKPLDELDEERETLKRKIEEDRHIMNDENSSPELKRAAAVRFSENTDELARLEPHIQEREEALPLRERVKNILKNMAGHFKRLFWPPAWFLALLPLLE